MFIYDFLSFTEIIKDNLVNCYFSIKELYSYSFLEISFHMSYDDVRFNFKDFVFFVNLYYIAPN